MLLFIPWLNAFNFHSTKAWWPLSLHVSMWFIACPILDVDLVVVAIVIEVFQDSKHHLAWQCSGESAKMLIHHNWLDKCMSLISSTEELLDPVSAFNRMYSIVFVEPFLFGLLEWFLLNFCSFTCIFIPSYHTLWINRFISSAKWSSISILWCEMKNDSWIEMISFLYNKSYDLFYPPK